LGLLCAVSLREQPYGNGEETEDTSSQNAEIKKGGLRSGFLFHKTVSRVSEHLYCVVTSLENTAVFVTLLVALGASLGIVVWNHKSVPLIPKSVAVLPFENLSDDPDNAYFAEGIQDEILTRLASVADLKVISRTSTQRYHSKSSNLADIAKQLGVANIVEGSVQKTAGQVRVNVRLINAQTDSDLWAETYDRKFTDIFGIESEIAKGIAESLQAKLTGSEEQALAAKPTTNPEAYDAYLRGVAFEVRYFSTSGGADLLEKAAAFFERAVQLDSNFALAWARLSRADARLYFWRFDTNSPVLRNAADRALEAAQKLEPDSPETLLASGYYQFYVLRDYGQAKAMGSLNEAARNYAMLRQFPTALKLFDRMLDITPSDPDAMAAKAYTYQNEGNLQEAARFLPEINCQTSPLFAFQAKINQLRFERNYGEAVRLLQARVGQFRYTSHSLFDKNYDQLLLAFMQRLAGDTAGARATAEQARDTLEQLYRNQPDDWMLAVFLSQTHAVIGERDLALELAERAVRILPRGKDAMEGPALEENLAVIQTMYGENSRAISTLSQLLQTRYNSWFEPWVVTPAVLRLDPLWDPLRGDPAFQKLCEEKQP
jgi:TolB-like protein/Flp pilus assembly protein TadD